MDLTNMNTELIKTDDLQWCKHMGERLYQLWEIVPYLDDAWRIVHGLLDLNDYEKDLPKIVAPYYGSMTEFEETLTGIADNERIATRDQLLAEMCFESDPDFSTLSNMQTYKSIAEAEEKILHWDEA